MANESTYRLATDGERLRQIEQLLVRYPDIAAPERGEILHYLRKGPGLDTGLLTGIEEIKPKLDRFREDHRDQLGLGIREYAAVAVFLAVLAGLVILLWH